MSFIVFVFFKFLQLLFWKFLVSTHVVSFLLSQIILNCPSVRCQTIFKSIVWVWFGWQRLEGILCIIRLHFVSASKQISLFTVDHQMMTYGILSLVRLSRKNYWDASKHWSSSLFLRVSGFAFLQRSSSSPLSSLCEFLIPKFP